MARSNHQSSSPITHPDEYTRTRLLNRLGLFQHNAHSGRRRSSSSSVLSSQHVDFSKTTLHPSVIRNGGQRLKSTLKPAALSKSNSKSTRCSDPSVVDTVFDDDNRSNHHHQSSHINNNNNNTNKTNPNSNNAKIQFNETVEVISIPSRHQFSNRIKNVYWSNRYELQENAERNILEYEYEGWDYHNVVLDEDMYVDTATGSLIHPCHLTVDETTGKPVFHSTFDTVEEDENVPERQQQQPPNHQQQNYHKNEEKDDDNDGFEYEDDDSYFRPLQRQSSVASSQ